MNKRINVILPESTLALLDRVAIQGRRSLFISQAVIHFANSQGEKALRSQLAAGYKANADDALKMAAEWFPLEEEAWQTHQGSPAIKRRKK